MTNIRTIVLDGLQDTNAGQYAQHEAVLHVIDLLEQDRNEIAARLVDYATSQGLSTSAAEQVLVEVGLTEPAPEPEPETFTYDEPESAGDVDVALALRDLSDKVDRLVSAAARHGVRV